MNKSILLSLVAITQLVGGLAVAQTPPPAADNARSNKTDPSNTAMTADAQKNDAVDIALTKHIRRSVMADKSLSADAHNAKIISIDGSVTLNGVVRSEAEKSAVEMKAAQIAGKDHVSNDLKIAPGR
jgi:osmotically-inducible protein OsmY